MIPITKPFLDKNDLKHIKKVLSSKILTDGFYQGKSENIIKDYLKSKFVAVTHSCTAALEISAILIDLKEGDEVILPSYGFVSIANAIVLRGAKPVFVEINSNDLNISYDDISKLDDSWYKNRVLCNYVYLLYLNKDQKELIWARASKFSWRKIAAMRGCNKDTAKMKWTVVLFELIEKLKDD